ALGARRRDGRPRPRCGPGRAHRRLSRPLPDRARDDPDRGTESARRRAGALTLAGCAVVPVDLRGLMGDAARKPSAPATKVLARPRQMMMTHAICPTELQKTPLR